VPSPEKLQGPSGAYPCRMTLPSTIMKSYGAMKLLCHTNVHMYIECHACATFKCVPDANSRIRNVYDKETDPETCKHATYIHGWLYSYIQKQNESFHMKVSERDAHTSTHSQHQIIRSTEQL
jgi:hypothetical protein